VINLAGRLRLGGGGELGLIGTKTLALGDSQGFVSGSFDFSDIDTRAGDLAFIALSFDTASSSSWSWQSASGGTVFTAILDQTSTSDGNYHGYKILDGSETQVYPTWLSGAWDALTICLAIFRGPNTLGQWNFAAASSGAPNPPAVEVTGSPTSNLSIITLHEQNVGFEAWGAPAGYEMACQIGRPFNADKSSTAIAFKYPLGSDIQNPGSFTGSTTGNWTTTTNVFTA
jgi:hypothetical protein